MITTHDHGALRTIRLARPPVNALDPTLCAALIEAVESAVADGCEGLVLAGGQKVFSAGLDVPFLMSLGDDTDALRHAWAISSPRHVHWPTARCRWSRRSPGIHRPAAACSRCAATIG